MWSGKGTGWSLACCSVQTDAWFEVISIVMNMAIWHSKHAALKASSDRYAPPLTHSTACACTYV